MADVRRAVIYLVLAAIAGLIGVVSLTGELGAEVSTVDGVIVGTHTGRTSSANGGRHTVYYVDVERQDTFEQNSVRNQPLYDAYAASGDPNVTLDIIDVGSGVERIGAVQYLGHTYEVTTSAEGIGVAIAFLVLAALLLLLGIRRAVVSRRPSVPLPPPSSVEIPVNPADGTSALDI